MGNEKVKDITLDNIVAEAENEVDAFLIKEQKKKLKEKIKHLRNLRSLIKTTEREIELIKVEISDALDLS